MPKDTRYRQLRQQWYDVLKIGGFEDIEDRNTGLLKEWDVNFFRNKFNQIKYESTLGYYDKAKDLLISHNFKNELHKNIWYLHCDGFSERKIALKVKKYKKSMVHYIIANIAKIIKLKSSNI